MYKRLKMNRVLSIVIILAITLAIFYSTFKLKAKINELNASNGHSLSAIIDQDPKVNQFSYETTTVGEPLTTTELLAKSKELYLERKIPKRVVLTNLSKINTKKWPSEGKLQSISCFYSKKRQEFWYTSVFPMKAVFKNKANDIFEVTSKGTIDLQGLVLYYSIRVKGDVSPKEFINYLPAFTEDVLTNLNSAKHLESQVRIESDWGEYIYNTKRKNQLLRVIEINDGVKE